MNAHRFAVPHRFDEISCSQCGKSFGSGNFGYSHCSDHQEEHDYLAEARKILAGTTMLIPTFSHLQALELHYQNEIIKIVHDIDQVTKATLKRN